MLRIDRRLFSHFEWPLLMIVMAIVGCGLATIMSATSTAGGGLSSTVMRQGFWTGIGLAVLIASQAFDYRLLTRYGYIVYGGAVGLLLAVLWFGTSGGGAQRWLPLGPVRVQPSELMKVALVLALVRYLHRRVGERRLSAGTLAGAVCIIAVPAYLVLIQPDLGTVVALGLGAFTVLVVGGLPLRIVVAGALAVSLVAPYGWKLLKPYQQERILSFLDPQRDPLGAGYHVIQSKIAIGSGMLHGKGYLQGTQNHLHFIPEQHTDFIFSVFAEEWGFIGSMLLLALYAALILRGMVIATKARDNLGALLAAGLTSTIFWQVVVNIAMTTGWLPVVGITLPFLSYGGSSMVALMLTVGLMMNVSMRRYTF
jgi:rod shape determining protein RodA